MKIQSNLTHKIQYIDLREFIYGREKRYLFPGYKIPHAIYRCKCVLIEIFELIR